jgi:8-amino-7-oxononanoate synthase
MTVWARWAAREGDAIRADGRWRAPRAIDASGPTGILHDRPVVSFASNDYLGLTQHRAVVDAAHRALDRWGAGSGAARLIVGSRPCHSELETALADWKQAEAAALFPTGFAANLGVITTVAGPATTVLSDELNHASIIDGCRLSRAAVSVYRHADAEHCAWLLDRAEQPAVVVTDAVFSMDGDIAPLDDLAAACRRRGALLVVDEAHTVLGPDARPDCEVLRVGTLSKTLGALGGFVAGDRVIIDLIVNRARSYIFTTASTPADTAAALAALHIVRSSEGEGLRAHLRQLVDLIAPGHPSPIIPLTIGDDGAAVHLSDRLLERGLLVPAIRPPTVPVGTARLRIALSAAHTTEQVAALADALDDVTPRWRDAVRLPIAAPPSRGR